LLTAKKIAQKEKFAKNGYKILINNGKGGGQLVTHLHLHLLSGDYDQIKNI
jgi:histidine triad (HIT) family protein